MSTLLYIANQRLPTEKAYGLQIGKMCESFADRRMSVELLVPTRQNGDPQKIFEYYGVRRNFSVTTVLSPDFYWPGVLDRVAFFIKQWLASLRLVRAALLKKSGVIYSRDEFPVFLASFYSHRPTIVFEAHTFSPRRKIYYRKFRSADVKIIAISKGVRDAFVEFGYDPKKVCVAHDGVDINQFVVEKTQEECRSFLDLPRDKKLILYTGHLYPWKGAHVFAQAAKNLNDQYTVVFVGGTSDEVARYKHTHGAPNIIFLGHQPHHLIPTYLKAADIVVLPNSGREAISRIYTSPLKMFEYMASGTPIIASDLPSIREILTSETAFFFQPDNPKDLARTIEEVAKNSLESHRKAQQALQDVKQYSWQTRASHIIQFLGI